MYSFDKFIKKMNIAIGKDGRFAFLSVVIIGFLSHALAMLMDSPNHDGLASMYFDQNMISSGRWFLGTACGISSFFSLPWLISVLSLIYLGITAIILVKLLKVETGIFIVLISGLLVSFPVVASMFAYVFTMDGYMLGLLLSVLSVYLVGFGRYGFLLGAVALSFSMGIYQAYLPVAVLLSAYSVLMILASKKSFKDKVSAALKYLYMGALGSALYYVILKVLLAIEGRELASYQGINGAALGENPGILAVIKTAYADFVTFTVKGNIISPNVFALCALALLMLSFIVILLIKGKKEGWLKSVWFYAVLMVTVILMPLFTNVILFVSTDVTYHLLMRYQWVFLLIIPLAFTENVIREDYSKIKNICFTAITVSAVTLAFSYVVTDNIAYGNLQKKYEKTYAYCLRLADRIEQTEGYYQGIPIYMIGVVGDKNYPTTDITGDVTGHMIGMSGDYLVYTGPNYQQFMKHYFGITFNILDGSDPILYYEDWYTEMPSFPAEGSIKIVDGILCVKTENQIETE